MIRYDYRCRECNNIFVIERKSYKDKKKPKCPKCKSFKVKKVIGAIPVIYKGDGFTLANKSE
jgi:putative FmdB family regulatory protein